MKRLLALAAFLLASTAAQAQYSFQYGGRTINIDPDRGTVSIPGVYDNTGRKAKRPRGAEQDPAHKQAQPPQQAKVEPQAPVAPAPQATAPASEPPAVPAAPEAPGATTGTAPTTDATALPPPPAPPVAAAPAPQ